MQTLSTQMQQAKALSLVDVAQQSVSNVSVAKSSSENAKTTFQAELAKQVRAKQNQAQVKQDKTAENTQNQSQQKPVDKETVVDKKSQAGKAATEKDQSLNNSLTEDALLLHFGNQIVAARDISGKTSQDELKASAETDVIDITANNQNAVVDLIATPVMQGQQPNASTMQAASESKDGLASVITTSVASSPKNLSVGLNNSAVPKGMATTATDDDSASNDVIAKSESDSFIDLATVNPESKTIANDLNFNKAMANVTLKEMQTRDATPNTVQVPSATANVSQNNNFVTQQLASTNMISVYPGKSGWDQAISQKVMWMVGAGQQSASLTLNPPDLGPLKVVINVHNDQADTTFISDNDEVRKALEAGMSHLRDKMNESGIQLGQANVSTSQQSQQEFQQSAQTRANQSFKNQTSSELSSQDSQPKVTVRISEGLVDTFA
ncbi:MAG: flagellar hook-length control protein FliK [Methylotenera sp.]|nr:MAG: flagellar hook-length control protein FliK [Methylotenera sp.]